MKKLLLVAALGVLAAMAASAAWVYRETRSKEFFGASTAEFVPTEPAPEAERPRKVVLREPWPTYGEDPARSHVSGFSHRPPFRRLWHLRMGHYLEYPPVVAYGRLYVPQQRGRFYVVNPENGHVLRRKNFHRCSAASPTVWHGTVYHALMYPLPCQKRRRGAKSGFVVAMDAITTKEKWRFRAGAIESSLLVVDGILYFGSWDGKVYAVNARNGRLVWSYRTDDRITSSAAYGNKTIYIGVDSGRVYALAARTGKLRWRSSSFTRLGRREYFYATPTLGYGRVFIGNTDGIVYAFGATTGRTLWAQRAGTYVYTAAAVWRKTVYVGTFDGWVVAFDAATGRKRWRYDAPGSIIGAPTVMDGLIYFSICGTCGPHASRHVEFGKPHTFALDARTGKLVWRFPDGKYSPVVADSKRVYLVGRTSLYALESKARARSAARQKARGRAARRRAALKRRRTRTVQ